MGAMNPEEFTKVIKNIDEDELEGYLLENCMGWNGNGKEGNDINLKYVTVIDAESDEIKIELRNFNAADVDEFSLFKYVYGTNNILQYTTDCYPSNNPLVVQGASSGITNTANSIITDIHRVGVAITNN